MKQLKRITVDPNQLGGTPCIRGSRTSVSTVVGMVGEGMSEPEILKAYPDLEVEDIREALRDAAENLVADLTEEQLDGIRRRVRSGIAAIETGKFNEYEGLRGLRKLAERVKRAGRFPTKSR
jgi:uncharacterized protein (DUF433 family)